MPIDACRGENLDARHDESTLGILYLPAHISSMLLEPNQTSRHGLTSKHTQTGEKYQHLSLNPIAGFLGPWEYACTLSILIHYTHFWVHSHTVLCSPLPVHLYQTVLLTHEKRTTQRCSTWYCVFLASLQCHWGGMLLVSLVFCLFYSKLVFIDKWCNTFQSETIHFSEFMQPDFKNLG